MKRFVLAICLIMLTVVGHADENYKFSTNVEGMVNINGFIPGAAGNVNVGVNVSGDEQEGIEYTFEVIAKPIQKRKPYYQKIDQIHYALAGLSTNTSMLTGEVLPWRKTLSGNGIMTGNLVVAYDRSLNKATHSKSYKLIKNTEIVLAFYQADRLLKKIKYRPGVENPTAELKYDFENMQSRGGSTDIGSVTIDGHNVRQARPVEIEETSSEYTFEVLSRPIDKGRPCLELVERLNYRLNFRGGVVMDHLNQVDLPFRKTFDREEANAAYLSTDFVNSLDPFFNKTQAKRARNTILVLNIYNGPELMKSIEYHPTKDKNDAELEIEINQE